jgi:hypothetical protein
MDSQTQKTPDLARRKAVGCNPMLDGSVDLFTAESLEALSYTE